MRSVTFIIFVSIALLLLLPAPASAFGAGNIASISKVEGRNWRHGDIEDMLKTVACLKGHKWSSMMIKRVYFGNWLRDYSQAVDVGTLKGVQKDTIRILVWVLAFMSFGYATAEFEVTEERLGVYRPEEHIDNPKDYADNTDARQYDNRLREPIHPEELAIDPYTGMKNYIANERGFWATSAGYIRFSFSRAIHFGRMYTHGRHSGREEDLCEALRCLGQGLHCVEDFGAHTNYTELALRELGFDNVFPHTGTATQMNIRGKYVFPLVTGTFGGVDFLHSVLGEATDHFTQSEIDEMNIALGDAAGGSGGSGGKRSVGGSSGSQCDVLCGLLDKIPGSGGLVQEALNLQKLSNEQKAQNESYSGTRGYDDGYSSSRASGAPPPAFSGPPGSQGGPPGPGIPGMNPNFDPQSVVPKIYPILEFRDKVVRSISAIVSRIPGLESLIEKITERVTLFVLSLLAPFIQPIIKAASDQLKQGSSAVVNASGKHQYEPWTDPHCTDPTHSLLSKDHFSNVLNEPAGQVATVILQYIAPRIIFAMDNPDIAVDQVLDDVVRVFHHPALRDPRLELHRQMFDVVERWTRKLPDRGRNLNNVLSSESVRAGKNHSGLAPEGKHGHHHHHHGPTSHSKDSPFDMISRRRGLDPEPAGGDYRRPSPGGYAREGYDQGYSGQSPFPQGGVSQQDPYTYPTAYQQGYEEPYHQAPPPQAPYSPQPPYPQEGGYGQGSYGGGHDHYGGQGRW
ncbi:heterokaryon incompatibility Het-C [Patellaria atrata CBS 101060]|uniref:Heterokaryon incompatibility Het-C n=1 Tax=Patellaria atrata CBS 101060 TaxID=1346257 RepID=A0A9P4VUM9_9PEZI|nr:heterokaryon incompatibility Het-C [Patellaria atrata CBS 101060]